MKKHKETKNKWGGDWAEKKLDAFAKYMSDYLSIVRRNPSLKTIYFDGFAGSGERKTNIKSEIYEQLMISETEEKVYKWSAGRVINLPKNAFFDYYFFADRDTESLSKLEEKLSDYQGEIVNKIQFREGDCNNHIRELSKILKRESSYFALAIIDPFDMNISWESIASLKNTRSDIWIVVPTVAIVNLLLDKRGELSNFIKLQPFLGMGEMNIKEYFFSDEQDTIKMEQDDIVKKVSKQIKKIADIYSERMGTIWANVINEPVCLKNSAGFTVMYLIYASNNTVTLKIANQIIKSV